MVHSLPRNTNKKPCPINRGDGATVNGSWKEDCITFDNFFAAWALRKMIESEGWLDSVQGDFPVHGAVLKGESSNYPATC